VTPSPAASPADDSLAAEREDLIRRIDLFEAQVDDVRLTAAVTSLLAVPLTIRQLKVLGIIVAGGGSVTAQRLATILGVSLATVSGIIDRLAENGMVTREENPADHRAFNLVATDEGTAVLRDLMASSNQLRGATLQKLAIADLRALTQGLEALGAVALAEGYGRTDPGA